ncbi:iron uptake porin [Thermoleptolyngbya oregonensis NK1-22]|uniref:Iron uptake porin n=1 Tax=Thermoleptolyngbya oregonensis NK1-22 TaxID=2547457 RepID=A0AA96Y8D3_9CYAN|nr:iron uptake porin [Thermoleptolyngbya oregonensis]WOB44689.1 iron uptake porin [Thermoleptolyngbya oregonensis NK1-22]
MRSTFEKCEKCEEFELNHFSAGVKQTEGNRSQIQPSPAQSFWQVLMLGVALMTGGMAWAGLGTLALALQSDIANTSELPVSELPVSEIPASELAGTNLSEYSLDTPASTVSLTTLDQLSEYGGENRGDGNMAQVTSVTEFSDVSPGDWAYEALAYLANSESQGGLDCLEGYPNGTYLGGRAMTRYEFAAGLASCLDAVVGRLESLDPEALARIEALQREFASELAALRGRVDALEAAVEELQANQFSTTTTLFGETIFSIADIFGSNVDDANSTVFQARVRLNFNTSFTGQDLLNTRLQFSNLEFFNLGDNELPDSFTAGNVVPMATFPNPYLRQTSPYYFFGTNRFDVTRLFYAFPVGNLRVTLAATGTGITDIVSSISPIDAGGYGSISFLAYNPIYDAGAPSSGIGLTYDFSDTFQIGVGYLTGFGQGNPSPGFGLFNGGYSLFGQLTFRPGPLSIGLIYLNGYNNLESSGLPAAVTNQYGITINYALSDTFNIGAWFNYEDGILIGTADYRSVAYAGYLAINDLGGPNNQLVLAAGVPPRISDYEIGSTRIGAFIDDAAFSAELSYRISFSDNISLTPGIIWTADPGNNNDNSDTFLGVLRTTFYF